MLDELNELDELLAVVKRAVVGASVVVLVLQAFVVAFVDSTRQAIQCQGCDGS